VPSNCLSEQELLAFHLGTLPESEVDRVADHLDGCPHCEAAAQQFDRAIDPLVGALRNPRPEDSLRGSSRQETAPDLAQPEHWPELPGYEVLGPLGRGGMGVVYRARQMRLKRQVALKRLYHGDDRSLARARGEAEALARLQHPGIVQIHEIVEHQGVAYLALELVEGGPLRAKLQGKPQAPRESAELVAALARAIHHAHLQGVVHRDLKPANVLLAGAGGLAVPDSTSSFGDNKDPIKTKAAREGLAGLVPKITDFGVAKQLAGPSETRDGDVLGTPSYMSPEQAAGQAADVGPTTDVYSLGVILYEMLTGRAPLLGPSAVDTLILVRTQEPVPPRSLQPRIPRDLETICLKCLEKEPRRRYASAAELADDLGRFLEGRPIHARPTGPAERAWRWCCRHPREAVLGAVAVAGLLLALGGWLWLAELRAERAEQSAHDLAERAEARARSSRAVNQALDEAGRLHRESGGTDLVKLVAAGAAAQRARDLLPDGDDELGPRVERVRTAIARDERQAREKIAQAARDRVMVGKLDVVLGNTGRPVGGFDLERADRGFQEAFVSHGIDVDRLDPAVAAEKIRRSNIRGELLGSLDGWLTARRLRGADWRRLHELLRRADPDPWRNRLRDAIVGGNLKKLVAVAEELVEAEQPSATLELVGPLLRIAGLTDRAIAVLAAAQLRHPNEAGITLQLGLCCREAKPPRLDEAIRWFTVVLALRPGATAYYNLGLTLTDKGDFEDGIVCVRQALAEQPDRLEFHGLLAELLLHMGRNDEASVAMRKVIQRQPSAHAWFNLGLALMQTRNLAEAETAYRKALRLDPGLAEARLSLAQVLQHQGQLDDALACSQRALKQASNKPELKSNVQLRLDNIRRWIALDRDVPALRQGKLQVAARDRVDLAELCCARGLNQAAARLFRQALAEGPMDEERPPQAYRQNAACAALAVALGQGSDSAGLGTEERARWRRRCLGWLREQLAWCQGVPLTGREYRRGVEKVVRLMRDDIALAPVRGADPLARLPEAERRQWQQLWADADALLKQCQRQR
jgi:serine/threonine-protein kinase